VYQWALFGMTELEAPLYRWIGDMRDDATDSPAAGRFGHAPEAIAAALDGETWLLGERFMVADRLRGCPRKRRFTGSTRTVAGAWGYVKRAEARPGRAAAVTHTL
jgi:glutathione S-transferase